ncbi:hypothetical protein CP97_14844 [Aurantiacibacter atlanticus]|uniref:Uncharacterized protein n=1 Tax=Aurantiacibacter atlanticus TaxID=1648404 RepID=A0A161IUF5_9SPHN|nr:hypothetical protein [Aurantiacibacter atlanticus]ANC50530.1 hypothetical protein CP97_14844 [Aurantiacibacter atlanticus]MDF1836116.1 hypothetical protein [Alteraurantiacibacter sp. bin_em_oilr2.035]
MNAYLARTIAFFSFVIPGMWYFLSHDGTAGWLALFGSFFAGALSAHWLFKRLATEDQRREDLTARLFND